MMQFISYDLVYKADIIMLPIITMAFYRKKAFCKISSPKLLLWTKFNL